MRKVYQKKLNETQCEGFEIGGKIVQKITSNIEEQNQIFNWNTLSTSQKETVVENPIKFD